LFLLFLFVYLYQLLFPLQPLFLDGEPAALPCLRQNLGQAGFFVLQTGQKMSMPAHIGLAAAKTSKKYFDKKNFA
jgi:hypothetical protein